MKEISARYSVSKDGKLDVAIVNISEDFWLLSHRDRTAVLDEMQLFINEQRDELRKG
jgi:hypothetical protein